MCQIDIKTKLSGRVLILGIGNSLKGDDGLGGEVIRRLQGKCSHLLIDAGSAPENYTGKIKELCPDTVVIVDAVELGAPPGTVKIVDEKALLGGLSGFFTTHNTPLGMFIDYLKMESKSKVIFVGVQPKSIKFGEGLSAPVKTAVEILVKEFTEK